MEENKQTGCKEKDASHSEILMYFQIILLTRWMIFSCEHILWRKFLKILFEFGDLYLKAGKFEEF